MKKALKRTLAYALTVIMLFGIIPLAFSEEEAVAAPPKQEAALKFLIDMELISGEIPLANEPATRSMLSELAVKSMGFGEQKTTETDFSDVKSDDARSGYVLSAYTNGLMLGYSDGRFDPNGAINQEQLTKVLSRMTGYNILADINGGSAQAYSNAAAKAGFFRGVSFKNPKSITAGELALAVKKALNVNMMEFQSMEGGLDEYKITEGKTLLSDKLKLYTATGQVTANYYTSLAGASTLTERQVEINRKIYTSNLSDIDSYLGREVIFYLTEDDDTIVGAERKYDKDETELTISSYDISNITSDEISYIDSEGNVEEVSYTTGGYLILNGLAKLAWSKGDLQTVTNGELVLIDSNKDGTYDVIFATQYKDLLVDRISLANEIVYFKTGSSIEKLDFSSSNKAQKLDLKNSSGEKISVKDISADSVLSVSQSTQNAVVKAVLSDLTVIGTCTEINDDEIILDGESFPLNVELAADKSFIEMDKQGVFRLNYLGKIAYTDYGSSLLYNYGYLLGVDSKRGAKGETQFKMLTEGGSVEYIKLADKVRINDAKKQIEREDVEQDASLFPNGTFLEQMIIYELNADGLLKSLKTAVDGSSMDKDERSTVFSRDAYYNGGSSDYRTRYISGNWKMFGNFILNDECKVFVIPTATSPDDEGYGVYSITSLVPDAFYEDVQLFDADKNNVVPVVVVKGVQEHYTGKTLGVVTKVSESVGKDGETLTKLTVFTGGAEVSFTPSVDDLKAFTQHTITHTSDTLVVDTVSDNGYDYDKNNKNISFDKIEPGDVICYALNSNGEAQIVEIMFRNRLPYLSEADKTSYLNEAWPHQKSAAPTEFYYYGNRYSGYAKVLDVMNKAVMAQTVWKTYNYQLQTYIPQTATERLYRLDNASIVEYDVKKETASVISVSEIEKDDVIFVYATTQGPTFCVVYK